MLLRIVGVEKTNQVRKELFNLSDGLILKISVDSATKLCFDMLSAFKTLQIAVIHKKIVSKPSISVDSFEQCGKFPLARPSDRI